MQQFDCTDDGRATQLSAGAPAAAPVTIDAMSNVAQFAKVGHTYGTTKSIRSLFVPPCTSRLLLLYVLTCLSTERERILCQQPINIKGNCLLPRATTLSLQTAKACLRIFGAGRKRKENENSSEMCWHFANSSLVRACMH